MISEEVRIYTSKLVSFTLKQEIRNIDYYNTDYSYYQPPVNHLHQNQHYYQKQHYYPLYSKHNKKQQIIIKKNDVKISLSGTIV